MIPLFVWFHLSKTLVYRKIDLVLRTILWCRREEFFIFSFLFLWTSDSHLWIHYRCLILRFLASLWICEPIVEQERANNELPWCLIQHLLFCTCDEFRTDKPVVLSIGWWCSSPFTVWYEQNPCLINFECQDCIEADSFSQTALLMQTICYLKFAVRHQLLPV